ncbi:hypothetical protein KC19_11G015900 [Ceratodon purpureus]|uniref:Uncharacterized protein n=1 Tax=Ceratodon purpureus TaxID=3225 RepID=A0A8T0G9F9_CERPU|nr:hypothetical protein KC19_11G015900 [Ceratodon purpureus]
MEWRKLVVWAYEVPIIVFMKILAIQVQRSTSKREGDAK